VTFVPDIHNLGEICGHKVPNKVQVIQKDFAFELGATETVSVELKNDFSAHVLSDGSDADWSMIYD